MTASVEQLVIPMTEKEQSVSESMTFKSPIARDSFIIQQRAYGYEVFLDYQGTNRFGVELYSITRRAL